MSPGELRLIPVPGLPEVKPGDRLAPLIVEQSAANGTPIEAGDVLVVTQKVVSKAEGRLVDCADGDRAGRAALVTGESVRILRRRGDMVIAQTRHGFVCANAGVDFSNVPSGQAALLPVDSDRSAHRIRDGIKALTGTAVGVIVSDTFGRPWRRGLTDVAIGCAGVAAVVDLRGEGDATGRILDATEVAVADELAGAAELVMGKASRIAAAIVRGVDGAWLRQSSVRRELVRPPGDDLFR